MTQPSPRCESVTTYFLCITLNKGIQISNQFPLTKLLCNSLRELYASILYNCILLFRVTGCLDTIPACTRRAGEDCSVLSDMTPFSQHLIKTQTRPEAAARVSVNINSEKNAHCVLFVLTLRHFCPQPKLNFTY